MSDGNWIIVEGVKPYDGRYEFVTPDEFTTREWGWMKRLAGYMPMTIEKGLEGIDPELFLVLALVAMYRAGKIQAREVAEVFERVSDSPFERSIRLEMEAIAEEDEEDPPPPSSRESGSIGGANGYPSSEISDDVQSRTGTRALDTSESLRLRSES